MGESQHGPIGRAKRWLNRYAERFEETEYTDPVPARDPFGQLVGQLLGWMLLFLAGFELVKLLTSPAVAVLIAVPWGLVSGILVRTTVARAQGMTIPEYSDYLEKRTDRYAERQDRERARELERNINQQIQELKDMEAVESVAVWGDGVEVELRQSPTEEIEQ